MGKNSPVQSRIVVIAGPTGSGKTVLATRLFRKLGSKRCAVLSQDNYYKDWSHLSKKKRKQINFDHKKAFDFILLRKHLLILKKHEAIKSPRYSFIESKRLKTSLSIAPKPYVIVEGLMPFIDYRLARLYDLKIYINANPTTCFMRRVKRDVKKRGDTIETVCTRYFKDVLPMQKKYVEPQKKLGDMVVNGDHPFDSKLIDKILLRLLRR